MYAPPLDRVRRPYDSFCISWYGSLWVQGECVRKAVLSRARRRRILWLWRFSAARKTPPPGIAGATCFPPCTRASLVHGVKQGVPETPGGGVVCAAASRHCHEMRCDRIRQKAFHSVRGMVARLQFEGHDGRVPPGVEFAARLDSGRRNMSGPDRGGFGRLPPPPPSLSLGSLA